MNKASTENNSVKRVKISQEIRDLYERRDRSLDNADPDRPETLGPCECPQRVQELTRHTDVARYSRT
jgi:hypothetical protein